MRLLEKLLLAQLKKNLRVWSRSFDDGTGSPMLGMAKHKDVGSQDSADTAVCGTVLDLDALLGEKQLSVPIRPGRLCERVA